MKLIIDKETLLKMLFLASEIERNRQSSGNKNSDHY